MNSYVNGRVQREETVHLFKERAKGIIEKVVPVCGYFPKVGYVSIVNLTGDDLTCEKCKAVLYGGKK